MKRWGCLARILFYKEIRTKEDLKDTCKVLQVPLSGFIFSPLISFADDDDLCEKLSGESGEEWKKMGHYRVSVFGQNTQ